METLPSSAARATALSPDEVEAIRGDFPLLGQSLRGKRLTYLDNAATTQKPASVIRGECEYYGTCNANVHRAIHSLGEEATRRYEEVRAMAARFIGAPSPRSIVFTRGTTESINLVAHAWGRAFLRAGDEIVLTEMEHHSNLVPWQLAARDVGAVLRFLPVGPDGTLDLDAVERTLGPRTRLLAVTHVSNVLGTVNPVRRLADAAHAVGARVLVDSAQGVPHRPIDVGELGCDFLAFSGHKMCGPTGVGFLYGASELLEAMTPYQGGGEMIGRVEWQTASWAEVPHKFEAGTPNIAGVVGMGAAFEYLSALGMARVERTEAGLTAYALDRLGGPRGLHVFGAAPERAGVVSFAVDGVHPHDLAQFLDGEGVAIRAGHMCAQPLLRKFGHAALNRASFCFYNTPAEIDTLADGVERARAYFGV